MSSPSTQLSPSTRMGIYEPLHQISHWGNAMKGHSNLDPSTSAMVKVDPVPILNSQHECLSPESMEQLMSNQGTSRKPIDKIQRRLAQNREAARKSRIRKKAYVQQLETSRLKLAQLEQELERARQQGVYAIDTSHLGLCGTLIPGIAAFEMEYYHWVDEQTKQICELRSALQIPISDIDLHILVDNGFNHYYNLFRMKADAAKDDVFYLLSGMWVTSAERFFLWIGGFRPSEILNILMPHLEPLTDQQVPKIFNLKQSSQQAEDALSGGMDKLNQTLAHSISAYTEAVEKIDALESQPSVCCCFLEQADHLRQQTLQRMSHILTTNQAARAIVALGEYFHRLRALSSLWATRPHEQPV